MDGSKKAVQTKEEYVTIDFISKIGTTLVIEGRSPLLKDYLLLSCLSQDGISTHKPVNELDSPVAEDAFLFRISIPGKMKLQIINTEDDTLLELRTGVFTGLGYNELSYKILDQVILQKWRKSIAVLPYRKYRAVYLEILFLIRILLDWRLQAARKAMLYPISDSKISIRQKVFQLLKPVLITSEAILMIPRAFMLRLTYFLIKRSKKRPLWIISDRIMAAGDNGEALFRYAVAQNDEIDIYFALSKKSADFSRLSKVGPVLDSNSMWYKLKFLMADKIISSHADIEITNPFLRQVAHFSNLFNFDFVFLQHGITRHDMTNWLNRYEKNIQLFITAGKKEYGSILSLPYYYNKQRVLLSGFPRYDYLKNTPKKKLIIAPTYRANLLSGTTNKVGERAYDPNFKHTDYFKFYNRLLNDDRFTGVLKESGMMAEFYLHPNFSAQLKDYMQNEFVKIPNYPYDYPEAFAEGSLLVSDYSSVVFDFAYLGKPIIYTKFDEKEFYAGHVYEKSEFFSDESDGFGEVTYTYEELISAIIASIAGGCKVKAEYSKRAKDFFYKIDKNNSERVYSAILYNESRKDDKQEKKYI